MDLETISIPTGPIRDFEWCLQSQTDWFAAEPGSRDQAPLSTCANSTRGTVESDFQTFCCDGAIIGWASGPTRVKSDFSFEDLSCCRIQVPQMGGIGPIPENDGSSCTDTATPTPLASLAATNINNAQLYLVTYKSAKGVGTSVTDWIRRETPSCLWVDTVHGVQMTSVTVEEPDITTLPPLVTDKYGDTLEPSEVTNSADLMTPYSVLPGDVEETGYSAIAASQSRSGTGNAPAATTTGGATGLRVSSALVVGLLLVSCFL